jgi:hypothetical protein
MSSREKLTQQQIIVGKQFKQIYDIGLPRYSRKRIGHRLRPYLEACGKKMMM